MKKKQALDNLLGKGRISQSTYDVFNREVQDAIAEVEKEEKALLEKMATKVVELERHVRTLEVLLADFEIRHVTGEIDEQVYQRQSDLLCLGLDATKKELTEVKEAADQLAGGELTLDQEVKLHPQEGEANQPEVKFIEESLSTEEEDATEHGEETVVQTVVCAEQAAPPKSEAKHEEKAA